MSFPCQLLHIHVHEVLLPYPSLLWALLRLLREASLSSRLTLPFLPVVSVFVDFVSLVGVQTLDGRSLACFTHCSGYRSGASMRTACCVLGALVRGPPPAQRAFIADAQASFAASFFS